MRSPLVRPSRAAAAPVASAPPVLPAGWSAYEDGEGRTYYANAETGETSWTPPASVPPPPPPAPGWAAYTDQQGRTYYANAATGETSWEPPGSGPQTNPGMFGAPTTRLNIKPNPGQFVVAPSWLLLLDFIAQRELQEDLNTMWEKFGLDSARFKRSYGIVEIKGSPQAVQAARKELVEGLLPYYAAKANDDENAEFVPAAEEDPDALRRYEWDMDEGPVSVPGEIEGLELDYFESFNGKFDDFSGQLTQDWTKSGRADELAQNIEMLKEKQAIKGIDEEAMKVIEETLIDKVVNVLGRVLTFNFTVIIGFFIWFVTAVIGYAAKWNWLLDGFRSKWDPLILPLLSTHIALTLLSAVLENIADKQYELRVKKEEQEKKLAR